MDKLLIIGVGGFLGAIARYGISGLVHRHYDGRFPLGTLTVNVLGCFVIGALMTLVEERHFFNPELRAFLMVGLLGSMTTFSTLGYETVALARGAEIRLALANFAANGFIGLGAVLLGRMAIAMLDGLIGGTHP